MSGAPCSSSWPLSCSFSGHGSFWSPSDFGVWERGYMYGWHRKGNEADWKAFKVKYKTAAYCKDCHAKEYDAIKASVHANIMCENCHGPALNHPDDPPTLTIDRNRSLCARCHARLPYKASGRKDIREHQYRVPSPGSGMRPLPLAAQPQTGRGKTMISRRNFCKKSMLLVGGLSIPLAAFELFDPKRLLADKSTPPRCAGYSWWIRTSASAAASASRRARLENEIPYDANVSRTWVERYVVTSDGKTHIDSPKAGRDGFTVTQYRHR